MRLLTASILVPIASLVSFFGGWKVKEIDYRKALLEDEIPPPAPVATPGGLDVDPVELKASLEAANRQNERLRERWDAVKAELSKCTAEAAASAGVVATQKSDPFMDLLNALWRLEVLATDVSLFVLDSAVTSVGVEAGARQKSDEVVQLLRKFQGWVMDTSVQGATFVETNMPTLHGYLVRAAVWLKEQYVSFSAFCDGLVERFLAVHPEHKDSLIAQNSPLVIGLLILIPCLFLWDLYLLGSCLLWCWIFPCCFLCWCCSRRKNRGGAGVVGIEKEKEKEKAAIAAAAEVLSPGEIAEAKEAAAAVSAPKEAKVMSPKESMKDTQSSASRGTPNPSPSKKKGGGKK